MASKIALGVLASLTLFGVGCGGKQEMTPPPPPLRPEPEGGPPKSLSQKDCEPTDVDSGIKPLSFDERSIPEGMRLAEQGRSELRTARSAEVARATAEDTMATAVRDFINALKADPYNIEATYSLAAAYATMGRYQCTINLLTRLLQMRTHPSKHAEVEAHIDHLLGRKQALDGDFADMRGESRFRALIQKMCEGTNDANCVYGGQRDNRER